MTYGCHQLMVFMSDYAIRMSFELAVVSFNSFKIDEMSSIVNDRDRLMESM